MGTQMQMLERVDREVMITELGTRDKKESDGWTSVRKRKCQARRSGIHGDSIV